MDKPLLIAETPNAGKLGHRFMVSADAIVADEIVADFVNKGRLYPQTIGSNYIAVRRKVTQKSTGRPGADETLVLAGVDCASMCADCRTKLTTALCSLLPKIDEVVQGIDWSTEKRLVVPHDTLARWISEQVQSLPWSEIADGPRSLLGQTPSPSGQRRKWWIVALIFSHAVVAAVGRFLTWSAFQPFGPTAGPPAKGGPRPIAADNGRFAKFAKDMESHGANGESGVRKQLLLALQSFEDLPKRDQQLIAGMYLEKVGEKQLLDLECVRTFLDEYDRNAAFSPLSFTSQRYRPLFVELFAGAEQTPLRAMIERKRLVRLSDAFLTLRKAASDLPSMSQDKRLGFLEMMHDLVDIDVKPLSPPQLPLFNDKEGKILVDLGRWFNSPNAKNAIPMKQFGQLYQEERIVPFSSAFVQYRNQFIDRIRDERKSAKAFLGTSDELTKAYDAIEQFITSVAKNVSAVDP